MSDTPVHHVPDESDLSAVEDQLDRDVAVDPHDVRLLIREIRRMRGGPSGSDDLQGALAAIGSLWMVLGDPQVKALYPALGRVVQISPRDGAALEFELSFMRRPYWLYASVAPLDQP
jgi:hypothetical protein